MNNKIKANIMIFLSGQFVSNLGDSMQLVILNIYIFNITNSMFNVSLMYIIESICFIIFGQVSGVIIDKINIKKYLIVTYFISFILTTMYAFSNNLIYIYIVIILTSITKVFHNNMKSTIMGNISEEKDFKYIQMYYSSINSISILLGPMIGSLLLLKFTINLVFILNAITFLYAAITIYFLVVKKNTVSQEKRESQDIIEKKSLISDFKNGIYIIMNKKVLFIIISSVIFMSFASGIVNTIFIGINEKYWEFSNVEYSFLMSIAGFGGILGSFIYGILCKKITNNRIVNIALLFRVVTVGLMVFKLGIIYIAALTFINSLFTTCIYISVKTEILISTEEKNRGKVISFTNSFIEIFSLAGAGVSSFLIINNNYLYVLIIIILINLGVYLFNNINISKMCKI